MTVNKSTNELTSGSPPNFKHSFSIFLFTKFYQNWRIYGHFIIRERPFNLKGGLWFFSKKNILIPNVAKKNILILVEEKNNNLIQSFCHIT
jgi:hypothetical protein